MSGAANHSPMTYRITVYPQEAEEADQLQGEGGQNLFTFLTRRGYAMASACGGVGTCGKCKVVLHQGHKAPTESEKVHLSSRELEAGWRLSCQQRIDREIVLTTPVYDETTQAKELLEEELKITLDPGVEKTYGELPAPGRDDQRPDTVRLGEELGQGRLDFSLTALRLLPEALREQDFRVTVTHEAGWVLDVEPGDTSGSLYGLAVDIGTTTLAGYLLDLASGRELAIRSRMNPQQRLGADVISRIKHVHDEGERGLRELQEAVISGIDSLIQRVCQAAKIDPAQIYKATVVGNPTMLHLFAGIPPSHIDHSPYTPVLREGTSFPAERLELGLNPEARVYIFPSISGYVGGDITAGVLFSDLHRGGALSLFVDIGTNAEIILGCDDGVLACSTPAGPAFEGARIKHGMSATPGAINYASFDVERESAQLEVISDILPRGICGSGLIDLTAELFKVDLLDEKGTFRANGSSPYRGRVSSDEDGQLEFLVTEQFKPIYLTQQDVRELQLAKGAIRAGIEILLRESGATPEDVEAVYLAGAFGNYVRRESALRIGMLPPFPLEAIRPLGNAAGQGAKLALLNRGKWEEVQRLTDRVRYLELSYHPEFSETFMKSMIFPTRSRSEVG